MSGYISKLIVEVVEAKDVVSSKNASLFVVVEVGSSKKKTRVIKSNNDPKWEQSFEFDVQLDHMPLIHVALQDKGVFGSTSMGKCLIDTSSKNLGFVECYDDWFLLASGKTGVNTIFAQLRVRLHVVKTKPSLKKKNTKALIESDKSILKCVRNNDYQGLVELLQIVSVEEVNKPEEKTGNTPLHIACLECKQLDERILSVLLEYDGIKADVLNTDLNTPLHYYCAKWPSPDLKHLHIMLQKGADVNSVNSNAETPIFKAMWNESIRALLVETLLENGANVNLLNSFGEGILHYAVRFGRSDLVILILTAIPDVSIKGKEGFTPRELAVQYKHVNIAKHLKKVEDLFLWLENNNLYEFKSLFLKNEIYRNLIPDMTKDILESLGIEENKIGLILEAARQSSNSNTENSDDNKDDEDISENLKEDLLPEISHTNGEWIIVGKEIEYLKKLGGGGSGDVYKGLYKEEEVAIKVLKEMAEDEQKEEFKKEFAVLCAIHHPNIVKFYGASFKPKLCMVMEYCSRGSLYEVLRDASVKLGWQLVLDMIIEMASGLEALHTNEPQILHRDMKSLNLLITLDWKIKVADFGLSRFNTAEALETLKQMRGTFAYLAPECYYGEKYTDKSDVYSLGIVIIEIMTRILTGNYVQPYSEFKHIAFDFQIIIHAAKENLRPSIPENTPNMIKDLIQICINGNAELRPNSTQVVDMVRNIIEFYKENSEDWDSLLAPFKL